MLHKSTPLNPHEAKGRQEIGQYILLNSTETFAELRAKHAQLKAQKDVEMGGLTVE